MWHLCTIWLGPMEQDSLTRQVIGCAIEVHRQLGPGLLESTYLKCLGYELDAHGVRFIPEHPLPVWYKGVELDCGYRIDLMVQNRLIVEIKSVDRLHGIHSAQVLTYMKLSGIGIGLLINFNTERLADGIKRLKR